MGNIFHVYGLIVGLSIVAAISLIEYQYKKLSFPEEYFWKIILSVLFFGVIGARVWHVATDFYLYKNNFQEVFYIWNGGLSIFGGVLGGVVGLSLALKFIKSVSEQRNTKLIVFQEFLDLAVFGLPVGQIIGRLGNYVNQELYGKPTSSFLKIYINPENRLVGYENIEYYHPLFFYEMALMTFFVAAIYLKKPFKVGSGKLFLVYVLYYSLIRFFLDFLRLDKAYVDGVNLGANQLILIFIFVLFTYLFIRKKNVS